ncbi:MAG: hypothetical protein ACFFD4_29865 [Candidatus Odinarchaeota archaeon]
MMEESLLKANGKLHTALSATVTLIIDDQSMNQVVESSLSPENRINPPAIIKSEIKKEGISYLLDAFERTDSLLKAVNDILGAAQLVESILLVLDEQDKLG